MLSYDHTFLPPAPFVEAAVIHPLHTERRRQVRMQLDTGADVCVLSETLIKALNLEPNREIVVEGYDGIAHRVETYLVIIEVEGYRLEGIEVIASPIKDHLLGRNVLNHFTITLKGKDLSFEIADP
jgi:predicted aspartyl protease